MNTTDLVRFEKDGIELYINTTTGESFGTVSGYARIANKAKSTISERLKGVREVEIKTAEIPTNSGTQAVRLITEQLICEWLPKDNPEMATKLMQLGVRVFLHTLAGYEVKTTATDQAKENLENQFIPDRSLKEIKEYLELSQSVYGEAYKQRLFPIVMKKYYPDLPVISAAPEEKASLPVEALLTPTQIASELGFYYSTGNPNPRKVNELLANLGYQIKIADQWSPTDKAKGLCDRKPIDTNSRSQKDQLMWSRKILDVLKEHVIN